MTDHSQKAFTHFMRPVGYLTPFAALAAMLVVTMMVLAEETPTKPGVSRAVCVLHPLEGSDVQGAVTFESNGETVEIDAEITGLTPGRHGFHIHEFGDCTGLDGSSAGGHFNPHNMPHAGPDASRRHVGDLGNLTADKDGVAEFHHVDKLVKLNGPNSIIGRSIIVHADPDDLKTQPSGNAGSRVACGVIGIAKPE